ncbi:starch-binding domain-containing protein 1 [Ascaphus truei]|uniref:starch-binding domain-containing protein 1 n=1 Tax=Ascaphus truei TaxID=8439 RepID=UPI003F59C2F6
MVQAASAQQPPPFSPTGGKQGSATMSSSSTWVAVVVGILTAIFAWIWFGRPGERKEAESQQNKEHEVEAVIAEGEQGTGASSTSQQGDAEGELELSTSLTGEGERLQEKPDVLEEEGVQSKAKVAGLVPENLQRLKEKADGEYPQELGHDNVAYKESSASVNQSHKGSPNKIGLRENGPCILADNGPEEFCDLLRTDVIFETIQSVLSKKQDTSVEGEAVAALPNEVSCDVLVEGETNRSLTQKTSEELTPTHPSDVCPCLEHHYFREDKYTNHNEDLSDVKGYSDEIGLVNPPLTDVMIPEANNAKMKRVAAVQPMPQNVSVHFRVHYSTYSESQLIAITGDHEKLGKWEVYIPLTSDKDGFWSHSVLLPADSNVEWKFVMVENGKIKRWEECSNRNVKIGHDDVEAHQLWGYLMVTRAPRS